MSIFAGVFCRRPAARVPQGTCQAIRQALSRDPRDAVQDFRGDGVYFAKVDLGAVGSPAFLIRADGSASMLAGEPLLATSDPVLSRPRDADLELLHEEWDARREALVRTARGVFCAVHYCPNPRCLTLVADKLGIRPLYYLLGDEYVVFATALRILEVLTEVPKVMDLRAVTEMASLGYPLGTRTPYADIKLLAAGEIIRIGATNPSRQQYWRWDEIPPSAEPEPVLLQEAHDRFVAGVAARLRGDRGAPAFLSGGLDSRCIVGALRGLGVQVDTFNFGLPGTQDQVFAAEFARAAGTAHHELPMKPEVELRFSAMLSEALTDKGEPDQSVTARRNLAWSGDGGSVGAGHVYLTQAMVDFMRSGRRDLAIDAFLQQQQAFVLHRLLRPLAAETLNAAPKEDVEKELEDLRCADDGRRLYVFLLLNDQRRHLANHFEELDSHRLELQLPFFDSDFLQVMSAVPLDLCLYHAFYAKWLGYFIPAVTAVPWQSYPGHVPCPLPIPGGLQYQWNPKGMGDIREARRRELLAAASDMLHAARFPSDLLRKSVVQLASWIYQADLRDYGYVLRHAAMYYKYWRRSSGRWTRPPGAWLNEIG